MMIKEDFISFLTCGRLTHFPYGIEKVSVIKMLGEPEEEIEDVESSMLKYDQTEFYFYKGDKDSNCLAGILIQPIPVAANRGNLDMDYSWLNKTLDYHQIKSLLVTDGIGFRESTSGRRDAAKVLITIGEVTFFFFEAPNRINKVGRFIPIEEFEQLNHVNQVNQK